MTVEMLVDAPDRPASALTEAQPAAPEAARPVVRRPARVVPPMPCRHCGALAKPLTQGLCHACYGYWLRTGHDRPLIERLCPSCGDMALLTPVGLCRRCTGYKHQHGRLPRLRRPRTVRLLEQIFADIDRQRDGQPYTQPLADLTARRLRTVEPLLERLPDRLPELMRRRLGLGTPDGQRETLASIGETWGITRERARQLQDRAISLLRDEVRDEAAATEAASAAQEAQEAASAPRRKRW